MLMAATINSHFLFTAEMMLTFHAQWPESVFEKTTKLLCESPSLQVALNETSVHGRTSVKESTHDL